jgi:hypothetical protein
MRRRAALSLTALSIAAPHVSAFAAAQKPLPIHRLAAGWRSPAALGETPDRMGIIELDWERQQLRVISDIPAPDRVHGLVAMPDGGFVAVASRPGHWLIRFDAQGRVMARLIRGQELPQRTFNGHVVLSHDGQWLFTTESISGAGMSWVSVRDIRNLHRVNQLPSAGFDAHHVVLDDEGRLLIANGGIRYAEEGRKTEFDSMRPSLALVDPETCEVITQWRLKDQRLSIRHLAWSQQQDGKRILGVGLQAKHDDPVRQRHAPTLAVLRGNELILPTPDAQATGYVGDIAPGPNGGFVLSGQTSARGLWWQPGAARSMAKVAELTEACALAPTTVDGTQAAIIGSAKGIALWSPTHLLRVLPWPKPMLPDNHMVLLRNA